MRVSFLSKVIGWGVKCHQISNRPLRSARRTTTAEIFAISGGCMSILLQGGGQGWDGPAVVDLGQSNDKFVRFALLLWKSPDPRALVPDVSTATNDMKQMRDHIAAHLKSIALLSLPEQEELDNAASDEAQSEGVKRSSSSCREGDQDWEPLPSTSDDWYQHNTYRWAEKPVFMGLKYANKDYVREIPPSSEDEDWPFIMSKFRALDSSFDPRQDPVLSPFVERARRIQMQEVPTRDGIPIIVIHDPEGLEVPEAQWSAAPQERQAAEDDATPFV
ncbi:MAG: hypothetical protein Q9216_006397 [Gyalolechia sp. 2 TL-2023]